MDQTEVLHMDDAFDWDESKGMFYLLTARGLMVCRNHKFYTSCVPAKMQGPRFLRNCQPFMVPDFPKIPMAEFSKVIRFFWDVAQEHDTEAAAVFTYTEETQQVGVVVPEQVVTRAHVNYTPPILPDGVIQIGDIHSHVWGSPTSSSVDVNDETHSPGLHIVTGHLQKDEPSFYAVCVVDGSRFELPLEMLLDSPFAGMAEGEDVPEEWFAKVKVQPEQRVRYLTGAYSHSGQSWFHGWTHDAE